MKGWVCSLLLAATLGTCGCATVEQLRALPLDQGEQRLFAGELPLLALAAHSAVTRGGLDIIYSEPLPSERGWMIVGQRQTGLWSYEEGVRVVLRPAPGNRISIAALARSSSKEPDPAHRAPDPVKRLFRTLERELGQTAPHGDDPGAEEGPEW